MRTTNELLIETVVRTEVSRIHLYLVREGEEYVVRQIQRWETGHHTEQPVAFQNIKAAVKAYKQTIAFESIHGEVKQVYRTVVA